jgi:HSP20 family protein
MIDSVCRKEEPSMADRQSTATPARQESGITRRTSSGWNDPLKTLQRLSDEMDRMMGFGFGSPWRSSSLARSGGSQLWAPDLDVFQKDDQLVVKADLPGLRREDVSVEITDDAITIQGERKTEERDEREGYFRSERSYGSFCRVVPLPEGAITDQAKATFRDGVLEVTMPAPPQSTRGRKLEITEGGKTKP